MKTMLLSLYAILLVAVGCLTATELKRDKIQHFVEKMIIQNQRTFSFAEKFSENGLLLREGKDTPLQSCSCQHQTCGCCSHLEVPRVHLNDTICLNASYLPKDIGVKVSLLLDGRVIISEEVSARNPPPICAGIPELKKFASLCLRLYNLDFGSKYFSGCVEIEVKLVKVTLKSFDLGCFHFPIKQHIN